MNSYKTPTKTLVELEEPYVDSRGIIQNLVHHELGSAVIISSNAGAVRAEHWHKEDFHYCYLISGELLYCERPVGSKEEPTKTLIKPGQLFFTGPNVEHSMYFTEDSVFMTLGKLSRTHEEYEKDLVRLVDRLIDIPSIKNYIKTIQSQKNAK
jgi:quercetin dioxygenase-like cupin family protein